MGHRWPEVAREPARPAQLKVCDHGRGPCVGGGVERSRLGDRRTPLGGGGQRECGWCRGSSSRVVVGCSRDCVGVSFCWGIRRGSVVGSFSRRRVPRGSGRLLVGHAARRGDGGRMVEVPFQLGRSTRWTRRRR